MFNSSSQKELFNYKITAIIKKTMKNVSHNKVEREKMIYKFDSRVRYSEIGSDKCLTLNSIVNYFQDCSTFHSEYIGLGIDNLAQQQYVWLLSSWQIVVKRYPKMGEEITVSTWPYDFKGFYGWRNFKMEDKAGNIVAYANTAWVFVDLKTGHPTKVTEEEIAGYILEEKLDMEYAPRKITIPSNLVEKERFAVRRYHIDTNDHVNNGQYIQMANEFIPVDFKIKQMRAEYKKAAIYGNIVIPKVGEVQNGYIVELSGEDGKTFAVVEFLN